MGSFVFSLRFIAQPPNNPLHRTVCKLRLHPSGELQRYTSGTASPFLSVQAGNTRTPSLIGSAGCAHAFCKAFRCNTCAYSCCFPRFLWLGIRLYAVVRHHVAERREVTSKYIRAHLVALQHGVSLRDE